MPRKKQIQLAHGWNFNTQINQIKNLLRILLSSIESNKNKYIYKVERQFRVYTSFACIFQTPSKVFIKLLIEKQISCLEVK